MKAGEKRAVEGLDELRVQAILRHQMPPPSHIKSPSISLNATNTFFMQVRTQIH